jgi:uncharacterized protein YjbI with pentapeptide repeats
MTERVEERLADAGEQYKSLAALRLAHLDLMRARGKKDRGASSAAMIRDFLRRAQAAGAFIADDEDRHKAQSILDYWTAELVSDSEGFDTDFSPAVLADPEKAGADEQQPDQSELMLQKRRDEAREQVRLAAAARQWRDAGEDPGYLLRGEALEKAKRFQGSDQAIDEFIRASEAARANRKKIAFYVLACVLLTGVGFFLFQFKGLPILRDWAIATIKDQGTRGRDVGEIKSRQLWLLGLYQSWLPPYDLSGVNTQFEKISRPPLLGLYAPKLRLHAPNFSQARFINVDFQGADLANASFNDSLVAGVTRFNGANLAFAKFREARILSPSTTQTGWTSFAGAALFRAAFDKAYFNQVNFSGADLRRASFWSVSFDDQFAQGFRNTAWWLADGWSSCQVKELIDIPQDSQLLKNSEAFKEDLKDGTAGFQANTPGTWSRARYLNGLAWTRAIWGVDLTPTDNAPRNSGGDCLTATAVPGDALEAGRQAVCLAEKLIEKPGNDEVPGSYHDLANFRDTHGYILLQLDHKEEARRVLERAAEDLGTPDALFRSAIANYAVGNTPRAHEDLEKSLALGYAPSHELWNLRKYIRDTPRVFEFVDKVWPASAATQSCRQR